MKGAFGDVVRDRPFWMFSIALTFLTFTTGIYTLATPFWAKYTLGASAQAPSIIFAAVFLVAILAAVWGRPIRVWGVKSAWMCAVVVMLSSAVVLGLA